MCLLEQGSTITHSPSSRFCRQMLHVPCIICAVAVTESGSPVSAPGSALRQQQYRHKGMMERGERPKTMRTRMMGQMVRAYMSKQMAGSVGKGPMVDRAPTPKVMEQKLPNLARLPAVLRKGLRLIKCLPMQLEQGDQILVLSTLVRVQLSISVWLYQLYTLALTHCLRLPKAASPSMGSAGTACSQVRASCNILQLFLRLSAYSKPTTAMEAAVLKRLKTMANWSHEMMSLWGVESTRVENGEAESRRSLRASKAARRMWLLRALKQLLQKRRSILLGNGLMPA